MDKIVIASNNAKKIEELQALLTPLNIKLLKASDFDILDVEETGSTFKENAQLKAETISRISGLPAIGDDSGLCVNALAGAPGIYTARYAGTSKSGAGRQKLLKIMDGIPNRQAHFICTIAFSMPNESTKFFDGTLYGKILTEEQGKEGLEYAPIFQPEGFNCSLANIPFEERIKINHRGEALNMFILFLKNIS